jgi:hypothetical protein
VNSGRRRARHTQRDPDVLGVVGVDLVVGDAVLFSPDRETHEVTAVGGSRLPFSVGAWV